MHHLNALLLHRQFESALLLAEIATRCAHTMEQALGETSFQISLDHSEVLIHALKRQGWVLRSNCTTTGELHLPHPGLSTLGGTDWAPKTAGTKTSSSMP